MRKGGLIWNLGRRSSLRAISLSEQDVARFWGFVSKSDACWNWIGKLSDRGYAVLSIKRMGMRASRISWTINNGPIPEGLCVCHSCDNRSCVNPSHLFLGTHQENMADMMRKKRQISGERVHSGKLTEAQAIEILRLHRAGRSAKQLSKQFGIAPVNVWCLTSGRHWKYLHERMNQC